MLEKVDQKLSDTTSPEQSEVEVWTDPAVRLAALRKLMLSQCVHYLYLTEVAGGLRSISYLKVCECEAV